MKQAKQWGRKLGNGVLQFLVYPTLKTKSGINPIKTTAVVDSKATVEENILIENVIKQFEEMTDRPEDQSESKDEMKPYQTKITVLDIEMIQNKMKDSEIKGNFYACKFETKCEGMLRHDSRETNKFLILNLMYRSMP